MITITIANQKGGVGKSTISVHLAHALVKRGSSVLFIDLDSQANSTKALKTYKSGLTASRLFDEEAVTLEPLEDITLIEGDEALDSVERHEVTAMGYFKDHLSEMQERYGFDYCVIDTPPAKGIRMHSALYSSEFVLSPIELDDFSLSGLKKMIQTILGIKKTLNQDLVFLGILANKVRIQSAQQNEALAGLLQNYSQYMIPAPIKLRAPIPVALSEGLPVWEVKGSGAAREAGKELLKTFDHIIDKMHEEVE